MKKVSLALLVAVSLFTAAHVHAGARLDADRVQATSLIDYLGFAWETGGFPPSNVGDVFNFVAFADAIDAVFGVDLLTTELTIYGTDLVSNGQAPLGGGVISMTYNGGTIDLYEDPAMNHVFGTNPPNATVPSTFTDGTLFLGGIFTSFVLFFDTNNGTGTFLGDVEFQSGSAFSMVQGIGFTFGGVLDTAASGGTVPMGYDLQFDGVLEVESVLAVEDETWGGVKNLYRQ